ncbi:SDR family NAD(P)-dependent oxidoreductase [Paenibacillus silvae]|nr:SDR family NAD(P)-dependent oxidoreductase [Paenibacillus silvae]MCK6073533.1 SDR family NAD(P)-dependent oxidoreductase [Paenibacillus silvae]MCK6148991.1 SDR family NAD(P)-dependent oxidoreductase [Paenibacillus silvae]MCK6267290.1 SDR family NAD(P)-dependent oxidoreductase [Paenibacillus silvae]
MNKNTKTPQQKINSGFDKSSTADEVLRGLDLSGRLAVVSGGYSGLGLETTRALVRAGAHVVVTARRPEAAREALTDLENVEVDELDLADLSSVRAFSERFLASKRSIDMLILNAGIMACPETRVGPGWEAQFATNHLGHFALTNLLWPALISGDGARVVSLSSTGHHFSPIRWHDIHFEQGYEKFPAYGQSKTAVSLFTVELDRIGKQHGVRAFVVHPGGIMTPLQRHMPKEEMVALGWIDEDGNVANQAFKSPEQGAATQVWAATAPKLEGMGGVYCEDCNISEMAPEDGAFYGVKPYAIDPEQAVRLWALSAELTKTDIPVDGRE